MKILRERLAAYAHNAWSGWMVFLFSKSTHNEDGSVTIPAELVARWKRQMGTLYSQLSREEQQSDLVEADRMIHLVVEQLQDDGEPI